MGKKRNTVFYLEGKLRSDLAAMGAERKTIELGSPFRKALQILGNPTLKKKETPGGNGIEAPWTHAGAASGQKLRAATSGKTLGEKNQRGGGKPLTKRAVTNLPLVGGTPRNARG